jgi:hypothetical protein
MEASSANDADSQPNISCDLGPVTCWDRGACQVARPPDTEWESYWDPFIEDLRGTPERLVHPECFTEERGPGRVGIPSD